MTGEIQHWVDAHDPKYSGSRGIHAQSATTAAINAAQGLESTVAIALATTGGPDAEAALKASEAAATLYREKGAASPEFIDAFTNAPATGMATLLDMSRIRANFDPRQGNDSLAAFNAYMQSFGQCPLASLDNNKSKKTDGVYKSLEEAIALIKENFAVDDPDLWETVTTTLKAGNAGDTIKLDLYVMELVPGAVERFNVNGAAISVTISRDKPKKGHGGNDETNHPTQLFEVDFNGYLLQFGMSSANWGRQTAASVGAKHFTTIQQWQAASSTPATPAPSGAGDAGQ